MSDTVAHGKVVSFTYELRGDDGNVIDASGDAAMPYLHGFHNIVPGLEEALEGQGVGATLDVKVPPEKGYGEVNPDAIQKVHRSQFPKDVDIQVGMSFEAATADGHRMRVHVIEQVGAYVTISANHPLAGQNLNFRVAIIDIRDATAEELAHGHVHGPGGHHH